MKRFQPSARRSEPRRDKRMSRPVFEVRIGDQVWHTVNWSLGGLLLTGSHDEPPQAGDLVEGIIMPPPEFGGDSDGVSFMGRIIRLQTFREQQTLALRFVGTPDERRFAFLERALQRRMGPTG